MWTIPRFKIKIVLGVNRVMKSRKGQAACYEYLQNNLGFIFVLLQENIKMLFFSDSESMS